MGRGHKGYTPVVLALSLLGLLWVESALPQPSGEGERSGVSRFQRTVHYLLDAPDGERAEFAAAALAELIAVYMAEADLARAEAAQLDVAQRGKLLGWSQAVDQYAGQLLVVLDDVEQGFPVSLRPGLPGPVTTTVADRAIILGHPRADQQSAYEMRVLTDFCSDHDCERMTASASAVEPIPVSAMLVNPLWTFTEKGPVCSNEGIEVHFDSNRNLPILRGLCEQLMQEAATLAMDLAWQIRHGVAIEWESLAIAPTPRRPEHLVRLNAAGDSVVVTLPLLYSSEKLVLDIKPWLLSRAMNNEPAKVRLHAADYGWETLSP